MRVEVCDLVEMDHGREQMLQHGIVGDDAVARARLAPLEITIVPCVDGAGVGGSVRT